MNCLMCASHRHANAAVALCVLCGEGVCLNHMESYAVTTYLLHPGGMVALRRPDQDPLHVHLCAQCSKLINRSDKEPPQNGHRVPLRDRMADRARQLEYLRGALVPTPDPT